MRVWIVDTQGIVSVKDTDIDIGSDCSDLTFFVHATEGAARRHAERIAAEHHALPDLHASLGQWLPIGEVASWRARKRPGEIRVVVRLFSMELLE